MPGRSRSTIAPVTVAILFGAAYLVVYYAVGVVPINLMLRRFIGGGARAMWLMSSARAVGQAIVAGLASHATLRAAGRARARLAGSRDGAMLEVGALMSGALAGAVDVGVRRQLTMQIIHLRHVAGAAAELETAAITIAIAVAVTLALIVRQTRTAPAIVD